jgi:hypothetical protein
MSQHYDFSNRSAADDATSRPSFLLLANSFEKLDPAERRAFIACHVSQPGPAQRRLLEDIVDHNGHDIHWVRERAHTALKGIMGSERFQEAMKHLVTMQCSGFMRP